VHRRSLFLLLAAGTVAGCGPRDSAALTPGSAPRESTTGSPSGSTTGRGGGNATGTAPTATPADYAWFAQETDLAKGFCFTWVKGRTPVQVFEQLGTHELERVSWQQVVGSGNGPRGATDRFLIGAARAGGWTLIVEDNGMFGVTDRLVGPLSTGTTVVSFYRAGDGHGRFLLLDDRVVRLDFDPLDAARRTGRSSGELAEEINEAGFGLAGQIAAADDPVGYRAYCRAAAFALAERLTGVAMTPALLWGPHRTYLLAEVARD
jgi:uncharacterized protein DUF6461